MREDNIPNLCKTCAYGVNQVNGRYCRLVGHYVTHRTEPPCIQNAKL